MRQVFDYFAALGTGKLVLWCYLIWYLVTVFNHFDPSPILWLNSLGLSVIIGVALMLSIGGRGVRAMDRWTFFRLFFMPFCVSSFSSLIKGQGYLLIVPPHLSEQLASGGLCALFVLAVFAIKRLRPKVKG